MATVSLLLLPILYRPACSDIHALQHHSPPKRKSIEVNTNLKKKTKQMNFSVTLTITQKGQKHSRQQYHAGFPEQ